LLSRMLKQERAALTALQSRVRRSQR
jgi:hypothetical protein